MNEEVFINGLYNLSGKVALVTGGGSGIGKRMAETIAKAGASVIVSARRKELLIRTVEKITKLGGKSNFVQYDLYNAKKFSEFVNNVSKFFGPPDILVNAAGINLREPSEKITHESWDKTIAINLRSPFFLAQTLFPEMKKNRWGRVINLASLQSRRAFSNGLAYGTSKGGIDQLTRAMAESWSKHGICCNAIAPGFFPTELTAPVFNNSEIAAKNAMHTAIGRNGELKDLDGITVFLASSASGYITGQTIYVDGGYTAK